MGESERKSEGGRSSGEKEREGNPATGHNELLIHITLAGQEDKF